MHFGDGEKITVEAVVVSVGRRPLSDNLGLEGTAVESTSGASSRSTSTCAPASRACSPPATWSPRRRWPTSASPKACSSSTRSSATRASCPVDYTKVPWCIYCHPEVAFAGLSEEAASEAGFDVVTKKDPYGGNGRALIVGEPEGLVKVICEKVPDGQAGRILGVHMVGPWVTEQLGQGYLSVNWEATPDEVAHYIQPHPTLSETFGETVLALTGRGLHVG